MNGKDENVDMQPEYDFSRGERGKFFRAGARVRFPVYLDDRLQSYLTAAAERKGTSLSEIVNDILTKEIEIAESIK